MKAPLKLFDHAAITAIRIAAQAATVHKVSRADAAVAGCRSWLHSISYFDRPVARSKASTNMGGGRPPFAWNVCTSASACSYWPFCE